RRLLHTIGARADAVRSEAANVRVLLEVGQRIQDRVVLCAEDAAMPGIGAGLGDDVYDRTGVAAVLGAELVANKNVLGDELGIGDEKSRAADVVVVIVLTVDLLVIVAAAQTVGAEAAAAVGIGKSIVARGADARN